MKEFLLSKSNIRKSKGLTVGLILLIMIATCFLNIVLVLITDFNNNIYKNMDKLNSPDGLVYLMGDISNVDNSYIESILGDDVIDYEINNQLGTSVESFPYGDGEVTAYPVFSSEIDAFGYRLNQNEIIDEDKGINSNYVYVPYQFNTGGQFNIGDDFTLKLNNKDMTYRIKGFVNNMYFGSNNVGAYEIIFDNDSYMSLKDELDQTKVIKIKLKESTNSSKYINRFANKILKENNSVTTFVNSRDDIVSGRTFLATIFTAIFIVISGIIILTALLMLSNNISNFIKENIKTLGVIKALGYTNNNVKLSFVFEFLLVSIVGSIIGISLSYLLLPFVTTVITSQVAIPYSVSFNIVTCILTLIITTLLVVLTVLFFIRNTKKITPIVALRQGIETHNFKKNRVSLEKSRLPLNIGLALKTTLFNMKQNCATFVIMFILVFMGASSLVLFQNFAVKPKLSLLTFEISNGALEIKNVDRKDEILKDLNSRKEVNKVRLVSFFNINVDEERLVTYIVDDYDKLNLQDVCYKGRYPKYNNEIAVSGAFAKKYGYDLGDEIVVNVGSNTKKFIISGFIQTANNGGKEATISLEGTRELLPEGYQFTMYYFDVDTDNYKTSDVIDSLENKYKDDVSIIDYDKLLSGQSTMFVTVASLIVIVILVISALVILLVLSLLIKTLINNKKRDYGILKALGFTSNNIILQNAISFMPTIILSVVISCIASYFMVNPAMGLIFKAFGLAKIKFDIPIHFIFIMGVGFVVVSFLIALWLSRKIKRIEPYKLLIGE